MPYSYNPFDKIYLYCTVCGKNFRIKSDCPYCSIECQTRAFDRLFASDIGIRNRIENEKNKNKKN